jgi:hypothetical protein
MFRKLSVVGAAVLAVGYERYDMAAPTRTQLQLP